MQQEININFKCNRKEAFIFLLSFWISFLFLAMVNVEVQLRELGESNCDSSQTLSESLMLWLANHSYTLSSMVIASSVAFVIIAVHTKGKERASQGILFFIHIFLTMAVETSLLIYPSYELWGNITITLANAILIVLWRLSTPSVSLFAVRLVFLLLFVYPITSSFLVQKRQLAFSEMFYRLFIFIWLYYAVLHFIAARCTQYSSLIQSSTQNTTNGLIKKQNQASKDTLAERKMSLNIFNSSIPNSYPVNENINKKVHEINLNITNAPLVHEIPVAKFSMVYKNKLSLNDQISEVKDEQSSESQCFSPTKLKPQLKSHSYDKKFTSLEAISVPRDDDQVKELLPIQQVHQQQNSSILLISQNFNVCASSCEYQEAKNYLVQFQADFIDNYLQFILKTGQQETQDIKEVLFHRDFCSLLAVDGEQSIQGNFERGRTVPLFKCDEDCQQMIVFEVNEKEKLKQHCSDTLFNRQYKIAHLQDHTGAQDTLLLIICTKLAQKNQNVSWPNILNEQEKSFNESNRRLRESSTLSALAEAEKEFKTYKKRILACLSHELRTPLNSIYFAFRSVMDELELPQQTKELLFLGFKNTELLRIILNTLIDYSQMDIEECEINFSKFSVDNLLQNCVDIYSGVCEMKKLSISYDFDPKYPTSINSDQERLMQIIVNLLSYCVRQTSQGSIQISLQQELPPPSECYTPIFVRNEADCQDQQLHSVSATEGLQRKRNKNQQNQNSSHTAAPNQDNSKIQIIITVRGSVVGEEQLKTFKKSIAKGVVPQNHQANRRSKNMQRQSEDFLTDKERALPLSPIFCAEMCKCLGSGQALQVQSDGKNFMQFRFVIVNQQSTNCGLKQTQGTNNELRFEPVLLRQIASLRYSSGGESDLVSGFSYNKNSECDRQGVRLQQYNDSKSHSKGPVFEQANQVQKQKLKFLSTKQAHTENLINNISSVVSASKKIKKHSSLLGHKQLQQMYQKNEAALQNIDYDGANKSHNVSEYFLTSNISKFLPKRRNTLGNLQTPNIENSPNYYQEQDRIYQNPKELNQQQKLGISNEHIQQKQNSNFLGAVLTNTQQEQNNLDSLASFNDFRNAVYMQTLAMRNQKSFQNPLQHKSPSYPQLIKSAQQLNQRQHDSPESFQNTKKMVKVSKAQTSRNILALPSNKSLHYQHDSSARVHTPLSNSRQVSFEDFSLLESVSVIETKNQETVQQKMESLNKQSVIFNRRQISLNSPRQRQSLSSSSKYILKSSQDIFSEEQDHSKAQQQILIKDCQQKQLPKDSVAINIIQSDNAISEESKE